MSLLITVLHDYGTDDLVIWSINAWLQQKSHQFWYFTCNFMHRFQSKINIYRGEFFSWNIGTSSRANSCRASAVPIFCILQSCHLSRASPGLCWQVTSLDSFLPPILGTARGPFQLVPSRASARKQSAKNVKWGFRKNTIIVVCVVSFDPDQLETSSFF